MRHIHILPLIGVLTISSLAFCQGTSDDGNSRANLEKQLLEIDKAWLRAARDAKLDVLQEMWTEDFFEVSPSGNLNKAQMIARIAKRGPDQAAEGAFMNDFKLQGVYGNFAVATDRTTLKSRVYGGHDFSGDYNVVRLFVKENGKWKPAGAALVPIGAR